MAKIDRVIKEIVIGLKEDTRGLTIQELSKLTKVSRITTSLALARLGGAGIINVRIIGNCRLHYLNINMTKKRILI
jgi:hypothetical protein